MPIDISAGLRRMLEESETNAKRLSADGKNDKAAQAYRRCAQLMRQLIDATHEDKVKKTRLDKARQYLDKANQLESNNSLKQETEGDHASQNSSTEPSFDENHEDTVSQFIQKSSVSWGDIGGLEKTKKEIIHFYAMSMASLPKNVKMNRSSSVLFYGPPGTGKTLLAAATSSGLQATFFNVKASGILSKYFGESSKMITAVFREAKRRSPSVVFVDEIDSLTPSRNEGTDGAETRLLSSFLTEFDGFDTKDKDDFLMVIGATNTPWQLDEAILSRFSKIVYVPLPDEKAREQILDIHLKQRGFNVDMEPSEMIDLTNGYSGRDIEKVCSYAVEKMISDANNTVLNSKKLNIDSLRDYQLQVRPIRKNEWQEAIQAIQPKTSKEMLKRYEQWGMQYR